MVNANMWSVGFLFVAPLLVTAQDSSRLSPEAVLKKVHTRYTELVSYHFEHTLVLEEAAKSGDKSKEIANISLTTASEKLKSGPGVNGGWNEQNSRDQLPFELKRMRLEAKAGKSGFLLASNGDANWAYNPKSQEYIESRGRAALGPTAATMFMSLHLQPMAKYFDGSFKSVTLLVDEDLKIAEVSKRCYVLSGHIEPAVVVLPPGIKPKGEFPKTNPLQRVFGLYFLAHIHQLVEESRFMYLPKEDVKPKLTMWVDQKVFTVWQSKFSETVSSAGEGGEKNEQTELSATHRFSRADINNDIPEEVFQFAPPKGAQKVDQFSGASEKAK